MNKIIDMFSECDEALEDKHFEIKIELWVFSVHEIEIILSEFERGTLEIETSRGYAENEAEIYVYEVTVTIDEDIAIVSVFDL